MHQNLIDIILCLDDGRFAMRADDGVLCQYTPKVDCKYRFAVEKVRSVDVEGVKKVITYQEYYCSKWSDKDMQNNKRAGTV